MSITTSPPALDRSSGRGLLWTGIFLALLGIALFVVQFMVLRWLVDPWYIPILTTVAVLLLILSVARRRTIPRILVLLLVVALAGFEWLFLVKLSKLPEYAGPARAGQKLPPFQTTLADGGSFINQDLETGKATVMTFFRGRW